MKSFWIPFWTILVALNLTILCAVYKLEDGIGPDNWWGGLALIAGSLIGILLSAFISAICAVYLEEWYQRKIQRL